MWLVSFCILLCFLNVCAEKIESSLLSEKINGNGLKKTQYEEEKVLYIFSGLEKYESIPVLFPKDICLLNLAGVKYAACLHLNGKDEQQFVIFKYQDGKYKNIRNHPAPLAVSMDCTAFKNKGFVALAYNLTKSTTRIMDASPVYMIEDGEVSVVQYFLETNFTSILFENSVEELLMFQTVTKFGENCPIYNWAGYHFNLLDQIPCEHARKMEPFWIASKAFVAVANYADKHGNTNTLSEIYKFDTHAKKFMSFQKIRTSGAIDVKHFSVWSENNVKQHFLVFANSRKDSEESQNLEADSVIYKYENGYFIPFQKYLFYAVKQFLPIQINSGKLLMLVACEDQPAKILQYNGNKFVESAVQMTEGALSQGVSKMRVFREHNETLIVVSNEKMITNETNVFKPIYKIQKNRKNIRAEMLDWSEQVIKNMSDVNLDELLNRLKNIIESKKEVKNPENSNTLEYGEFKEVITNKLIYPSKNITKHFWNMLTLATKAMDNIEERIRILEEKKLEDNSSPFERLQKDPQQDSMEAENLLKIESPFELESAEIGTLIVHNRVDFHSLNNQTKEELKLNKLIAARVVLNGDVKSTNGNETINGIKFIKAKEVRVSGDVNGVDLNVLEQFALRKHGDQRINASITINHLSADRLFTTGVINGDVNTAKFVPTDEGSFVIFQNINFTQPVYANQVTVNERLHNLYVLDGKLDVLLRSTENKQIVTGQKTFESLRVLSPITVSGQIFGPKLRKLSPIHIEQEELVLHGDYVITGNVMVNNMLAATNIFGSSQTLSIAKLLQEGIEKSDPMPINVKFQHPIRTDSVSTSNINGRNPDQFVVTNTDKPQFIKAHKTFANNLNIHGFCHADEINGIKIKELQHSALQKTGHQIITGKLSFNKLTIPSISSSKIEIGDVSFDNLLTTSTDQELFGTVKIGDLNANKMIIEELFTSSKVMDVDLAYILEDTPITNSNIILLGENHFSGHVNARSITIKKSLNSESVETIKGLLSQIDDDHIKFTGDIHFSENVHIENLFFGDTFNGVSREDFGNVWLLSELDQVFTAPQTMVYMTTEDDLIVGEKINNYAIQDLLFNTYWLNRSEFIPAATFEGDVVMYSPLTVRGQINSMNFPDDVLLRNSPDLQRIDVPVIFNSDIHVEGQIKVVEKINHIDLRNLNEFIANPSKIVANSANFEHFPNIRNINDHILKDIFEDVWLTNDNISIFKSEISFAQVELSDFSILRGLLNGVNLTNLAYNYFSLTRPQNVFTPLIFKNAVLMENVFNSPKVILKGPLYDTTRKVSIDFDHLVSNTLTKVDDNQTITADWNIFNVVIHGDLNNVTINDLHLTDDVVRNDAIINNITAPKYISYAKVDDLLFEFDGKLNGIDVSEWLNEAVLINGNYTIQGTTTIDDAFFYNDIQVLGTVNNISFDKNTLLLRNTDQHIRGNLHLITKYPETNQISTLTFENLYTNYINEVNVHTMFKNLAQKDNLSINGEIVFETALNVSILNTEGTFYGLNTDEFFATMRTNQHKMKSVEMLTKLDKAIELIRESYQEPKAFLSHFEEKQIISGFIRKIIPLIVPREDGPVDVIAVLSGINSAHLTFYKWDIDKQLFILDNYDSLWHTSDEELLDIFSLSIHGTDFLVTETYKNGDYFQNVLRTSSEGLHTMFQLKSTSSRKMNSIKLHEQPCFMLHTKYDPQISLYCLKHIKNTLTPIERQRLRITQAKQIVALEQTYVIALLPNAVQIWNPEILEYPKQEIPVLNGFQVSTTNFLGNNYLAVCTKADAKSLHFGSVEIFKSANSSHFEYFQTIDVKIPMQVEFATLPESSDLLLYILSNNPSQHLLVYEYKGIFKFQERVKSSAVPYGDGINVVNLKSSKQHLLAVISNSGAMFIESVLKNI